MTREELKNLLVENGFEVFEHEDQDAILYTREEKLNLNYVNRIQFFFDYEDETNAFFYEISKGERYTDNFKILYKGYSKIDFEDVKPILSAVNTLHKYFKRLNKKERGSNK